MLKDVAFFIQKEKLFTSGDTLIVAASGGKDSMALIHYLKSGNNKIIVAHCNFQLRGEESDGDAAFLKDYCTQNQLDFCAIVFDTNKIAVEAKKSIQEIARFLRYDWLESLRKEKEAKGILTAHHLNDNIETLLFKLAKGTGLKGVRGMLPKNNAILRPFLETSSAQILSYIEKNNIPFREDSSNASMKYDRNKIRKEIIPVLKEINPSIEASWKEHFIRWREMEIYHQDVLTDWEKKLFIEKHQSIFISIALIQKKNISKTLLFELLQQFHFNMDTVEAIIASLASKEAKQFLSNTHRILKDRKFLIISDLTKIAASEFFLIQSKDSSLKFDSCILKFHLKPIDKLSRISLKQSYAYLDFDNLCYPLVLRKWEDGDYFYPYGMMKKNGKPSKKKVSKYLKDEKVSAYQKENTWVLCSNDKIVWLVGHRIDHRFQIHASKTKKVLQLELK